MSKKYFLLLGVSILFLATVQSFAQTLKLPYKDVGACPFECCTYRGWSARKPILVFKTMNSGSPIAFKVTGMTGVVVTSVAGKANVLADYSAETGTQKLKKGDVLFLLTYLGEGYYQVWRKGKFFELPVDADEHFKIIKQPKSVWWVKIKNRKGQIGWAISDDNFDNQDQCG